MLLDKAVSESGSARAETLITMSSFRKHMMNKERRASWSELCCSHAPAPHLFSKT